MFQILQLLVLWHIVVTPYCSQAKASSANCQVAVEPTKELLITDLSVVNDPRATAPNGPWTFGHLIREMSPPKMNPSDFLLDWLSQWAAVTTVNNSKVTPRPNIRGLLDIWPKLPSGKLDLNRPPVRLLAIVNRVDVALGSEFGEGRFVFGVLNAAGNPTPFTLIFEYDHPAAPLPKNLRSDGPKAWARAWHQLSELPFGPPFNARLEKITRAFSDRGSNPSGINASALSQIRSNENALNLKWEFREFTLGPHGLLTQSPTQRTPAEIMNNPADPTLTNWLKDNAQEILEERYTVPESFLAGAAISPLTWLPMIEKTSASETLKLARKKFAQNTCNGCHTRETKTAFVHIANRTAEVESKISKFLTGDLIRRETELKKLLCPSPSSSYELMRSARLPIGSPH
ncbi:MAG: hypothetical protein K2X47_15620 [Bdellovibrionales bacterium]|nr:hypothetical protein [Bdellovibrionales bacterium]